MTKRARFVAGALSALMLAGLNGGCGSSAPGTAGPRPDAADTGTGAGTGGPGPSSGACECFNDAVCVESAAAFVEDLNQPRRIDGRRYIGAACITRNNNDSRRCCFARPAVCACYYGWNGSTERIMDNAEILGNRTTCDVWDRAQGCLYSSCEFLGCDPSDASSCDAVCDEVMARLAADEARTIEVTTRTTYCNRVSCTCRTVHRIADRCYASRSPVAKAYDCALSDDAILAMEYAPPPPGSGMGTFIDPDAGVPACSRDQ